MSLLRDFMGVLYVSQNGMLEGLGQSQVLGYLRGLARRGFQLDLVSYELATATEPQIEAARASIEGAGIRWHPLRRARDPRLRIKVLEATKGLARTLRLALGSRPELIHGRSSLATAVADMVATTVPRAQLLFDCRGMIGDEYVDAGYWTRDRLEYRLVKRYEARAFKRAEGVVVLTDALRRWLSARSWFAAGTQVEVIPCCVDLERFRFDEAARVRVRGELGITGDELALVYAGSLGSFYREEDMARFAGILKRRAAASGRRVRGVVLTPSKPDALVGLLERAGFAAGEVVVRRAVPAEMPSFLSACDVGMSFIVSTFSKTGSSPTKVAEYLACGVSVVLNGDIGDQADLAAEGDAAVVVGSFSDEDLVAAADQALALASRSIGERVAAGRAVAKSRFDLETVGVARYERLFRALGVRPR